VTFEGVQVNGRPIASQEVKTNAFVKDVSVK
jgi:hypothetical protein